jgi:hypothetical protein
MTPIGEESIMSEKSSDGKRPPEDRPEWYKRLWEKYGEDPIQPMTEEMLQQKRDHDWCLSQREVLEKYPDEIVAVYRQRVWGHGRGHAKAIASAVAALEHAAAAGESDVPSADDLVYVVLPPRLTGQPPYPEY